MTRKQKVFNVLWENKNQYVDKVKLIVQKGVIIERLSSCIMSLRKEGHEIVNVVRKMGGEVYSYYCLVTNPKLEIKEYEKLIKILDEKYNKIKEGRTKLKNKFLLLKKMDAHKEILKPDQKEGERKPKKHVFVLPYNKKKKDGQGTKKRTV